ncbi:MAG: hypothetical protein HWD61_11390 [Parachlamydiaceae bacterium]|nr:MAG: hypothetical protein HWD61_11390 [Parachlamydiaceae bacterium]
MGVDKAELILPSAYEAGEVNQTNQSPQVSGQADEGKMDSVSTMGDLKEKAPEVYRAMLQGIAMNVCDEMRRHQRRLKEIMRKARSNF